MARQGARLARPDTGGAEGDNLSIAVYTLIIAGYEGDTCCFRDAQALLECAKTWLENGEEGTRLTISVELMPEDEYEALPEYEA